MSIPEHFNSLKTALNKVSAMEPATGAPKIAHGEKEKFEHPFSKALGLVLKKLHMGYVEAEIKVSEGQDNNKTTAHAGLAATSVLSTMEAAASAAIPQKERGTKFAVLKDFGQRFMGKAVIGDELKISARELSSDDRQGERIKFVEADIHNKGELVGKALAKFAVVDKERYLAA